MQTALAVMAAGALAFAIARAWRAWRWHRIERLLDLKEDDRNIDRNDWSRSP